MTRCAREIKIRSILEGKASKEIHDSSRYWFSEKISANDLALSNVVDNFLGPLNRGIADLPLLRTLLETCYKPREPSFLDV